MRAMRVVFEVEQAGCESCGKLIGTALSDVGTVESIDIDEDADIATVVLSGPASAGAVDAALEEASATAGHAYRVRPDSWRPHE
jgi:copper chaperone CopZ